MKWTTSWVKAQGLCDPSSLGCSCMFRLPHEPLFRPSDAKQEWSSVGRVIAGWTCLGKLAPRGQRRWRVYPSSGWMWLSFPLTTGPLCWLCFRAGSSKSSFRLCKCLSAFRWGKLRMDLHSAFEKVFLGGWAMWELLACDDSNDWVRINLVTVSGQKCLWLFQSLIIRHEVIGLHELPLTHQMKLI